MITSRGILYKKIFSSKTSLFELSLYALSFISLIYYIIQGNSAKAFKCLIMAALLIAYRFIPKLLNVNLHSIIKISMLVFIFMAIFLAEILNFYKRIFFFDKILHSLSGILFLFVGQSLFRRIDNQDDRDKENKLMMVLFSFFFSLAVAGCWEIFEFSVDRLFGCHLQNDSLMDTMTDIICATVTASAAALYTIAAVHKRGTVKALDTIDESADKGSKEYSLSIHAKNMPL